MATPSLWTQLKRVLSGERPAPPQAAHNRDTHARDNLHQLREQELSVGAALRRGEPVHRAPGQTVTALDGAAHPEPLTGTVNAPVASDAASRTGEIEATEDQATAYAVAATSGEAALGYAAGGSMAGAVTGAAVHHAVSD